MSSDNVIHFKSAKKLATGRAKEKRAEQNRAKFGRTKAQKTKDEILASKLKTHLDGHKKQTDDD